MIIIWLNKRDNDKSIIYVEVRIERMTNYDIRISFKMELFEEEEEEEKEDSLKNS